MLHSALPDRDQSLGVVSPASTEGLRTKFVEIVPATKPYPTHRTAAVMPKANLSQYIVLIVSIVFQHIYILRFCFYILVSDLKLPIYGLFSLVISTMSSLRKC